MAYLTDPNLYEYSAAPNNCLLCFDPLKTSKTVFLNFADIQIGAAWLPGDPPPPNGTFELETVGPCQWQGIHNGLRFDYITTALASFVQCVDFPAPILFTKTSAGSCLDWFENSQVNPLFKWYGGKCLVVAPLPGGLIDLQDLISILGMEPSENLWSSARPIAGNRSVHAFYSSKDSISLLVKVQH